MIPKKITIVIVLLSFSFLAWNIISQKDLALASFRFDPVNLWLTVLLLALGYSLNMIAWHLLTKSLNIKVPFLVNCRIWIFSSVTRFLPGKVWQYPSRIVLLANEGVAKMDVGAAIVGEIVLNLCLGAAVVLVSTIFWHLPDNLNQYRLLLPVFILSPAVLLLFVNDQLIDLVVRLFNKLAPRKLPKFNKVRLNRRWIIPVLVTFSARFWLWGLVLFYMTNSLIPVATSLLPVFIGAFSIAWLIGYVAPFAPAGLGVTELSLAAILAPFISLPVASILAISFRVAVMITEAAYFLVVLLFFSERSSTSSHRKL